MRFVFEDTGLRVRNLDSAIDFFTKVLGMKLEKRVKAEWTKGEFANLWSPDGKHKLELNWYAPDSPV
ncbi:MAG TPA: VOC family protein, partial [Thermoplasmata archaeon]|nr:VOC family protein [Thermoplasmata archaeon]